MGYGWLIMLLVIGAVNVVSRIAAKRAEMAAQKPRPEASPSPSVTPSPAPLPLVASRGRPVTPSLSRAQFPGEQAAPAPMAQTAPAPPPAVVRAAKPKATAAAPVASKPRVDTAKAPSKGTSAVRLGRSAARVRERAGASIPGTRWTAGRLRAAFVAGEILGSPRSLQPLGGSAHEAR